jgi:hypothetical protein
MVFFLSSQPSIWEWLAPVLTFLGTGLLFLGGIIGVNRTNTAAATRLNTELTAARQARAAQRASERADQFRDEVASIVAEQKEMIKCQTRASLAGAMRQIHPNDNEVELQFLPARQETLEVFNRVEQLAIRASLFTNDLKAINSLTDIRELAEQSKELLTPRPEVNPTDIVAGLVERTNTAFDQLQSVTRELSTTDVDVTTRRTHM